MTQDLTAARDLLAFIDASPSPFHCVAEVRRRLEAAGFVEVSEDADWPSELPERLYVVRNDSTIAAFTGTGSPVANGALLAGAHTDSPCLRLRDHGEFTEKGYRQWGIEVYGGVIHHTWTDRDLGVAGRLVVREGEHRRSHLSSGEDLRLRVPNVAIHLDREVNSKCSYNPQTELSPIVAMGEQPALLPALAAQAGVSPGDILATELYLHGTEPSAFWGADREFIAAPRLDNQAMCHAILSGIMASADADPGRLCGMVLFDNEECGSTTPQGAQSNFLSAFLSRWAEHRGATEGQRLTGLAHSFFISADMAHALHPNYQKFHDAQHAPVINGGPVIKSNSNFRYATDARSAAAFRQLCERAEVPCQNFINRSDLGCGSTIGPMTAASLGMRTIDVGTPQFAMHSIRESAGSRDPEYINRVFATYYSSGVGRV